MSPRPRLAFILFVAALTASGAAVAQESYPRFRFSVFGDANLSYSTVSHATEFSFGEIDPYAEARFSGEWSALAEVLIHRIERGGNEDKPGKSSVELDLQRFFLAWSRSDALRLQAGQINTGIVEWNEREEVPRFLQTPIDVPAIATRPEQGGAWPLHIVGAWASGSVAGSSGFRYGVGLGAGRGSMREEVTVTDDVSPAVVASVAFAPSGVPGWTVGGAAFADRIPAPEGKYDELDETVSTSFLRGPLELRGEWGRMEHRLGGVRYVSTGSYALVSWRLGGAFQALRPYFLLDRLDVANDEPYLSDVPDQRAWSAGVRWDVSRHFVLKTDYQEQRSNAPEEVRRVRLQIAVGF